MSVVASLTPSSAAANDDPALSSPESHWGLNECEAALLECAPLVCNASAYKKLFTAGIRGDGINGRWPLDPLGYAAVVFLPGQRFEFAHNLEDASGHVAAVVIPARGDFGECLDIAAWRPEDGAVALWRGQVAMLGEDQLTAPRLEPEIAVLETVEDWLRAGRRGVMILDRDCARWRLVGERLVVSDAAFGARLRIALQLPKPTIFVMREAA